MLDFNEVVSYVTRNLLQKRNMKVQEEWLDACIQWLNEEYNEGGDISADKYVHLVFEQWLMSNLEDIGSPSLPANMQHERTTLTGNFMLQINFAYDIGVSAYSQLHKLDKKINENQREKSTNSNFDFQEEKGRQGSRMLYFELTDGCTKIDAIEYKPMPSIKGNLSPGCKIELKGPLLCEDGLILLSPANVLLLNGMCEDLFEQFSEQKILQTVLSMSDEKYIAQKATSQVPCVKVGQITEYSEQNKKHQICSVNGSILQIKQQEMKNIASVADGKEEPLFQDNISFGDDASFNLDEDFDDANLDDAYFDNADQNCFDLDELENLDFSNELDVETAVIDDNHQTSKKPNGIGKDSILKKDRQIDNGIPFFLLSDVHSLKNLTEFSAKTYIVTLLSRLETSNSKYHLDVYIDDGSAVQRASISNQVLEKLIGFPAAEVSSYQAKSLMLPVKLKQTVIKCQQKLATYTWNMKIKVGINAKLEIIAMNQWGVS